MLLRAGADAFIAFPHRISLPAVAELAGNLLKGGRWLSGKPRLDNLPINAG